MAKYDDDIHDIWEAIRRIDDAIRGNGKAGIQTRLDRLERTSCFTNRLFWLVIGAGLTLSASMAIKLFSV